MTVDDENSLSRKAILVWGEVMSLIHGRADNPEWSLQAPALIYDALLAEREASRIFHARRDEHSHSRAHLDRKAMTDTIDPNRGIIGGTVREHIQQLKAALATSEAARVKAEAALREAREWIDNVSTQPMTIPLVERLRRGATRSPDYGMHLNKYQALCDEAAAEIETLTAALLVEREAGIEEAARVAEVTFLDDRYDDAFAYAVVIADAIRALINQKEPRERVGMPPLRESNDR
jgi:hypothetical protein